MGKPSIFLCKSYEGDGQCFYQHLPCGFGVTIGGWFQHESFQFCPGCGQRIDEHRSAEQERDKRRNRIGSYDERYRAAMDRTHELTKRAPYWILEEVWIRRETGEEANRKRVWCGKQMPACARGALSTWGAIQQQIRCKIGEPDELGFFDYQYELKRMRPVGSPDFAGRIVGSEMVKVIPIQWRPYGRD